MKYLTITCDSVSVETKYHNNQVEVSITNPDMSFLERVSIFGVLKGYDLRLLFAEILKVDESILEDYLKEKGQEC